MQEIQQSTAVVESFCMRSICNLYHHGSDFLSTFDLQNVSIFAEGGAETMGG